MESKKTIVVIKDGPCSEGHRSRIVGLFRVLKKSWKNNGILKFIVVALGIFASFITVGILKEKVMRGCYGDVGNKNCPQDRRFKYATTLVGSQMLCAFIVIKIVDMIKTEKKDSTPLLYYIFGALANIVSMISATLSLRFVPYPIEVIFKSAKPIAVMISSLIICKRYPIYRYFFVLMIVVGVIIFKLFEAKDNKPIESVKIKNALDIDLMQVKGIGLLLLSLCMDGTLGAIQDRIRDLYSPSSRQMMLSMTACVNVIIATIVIVTGEIIDVYNFAKLYPIVLLHLLTFGVAGAIGQLFIFTMLSTFGALTLSITTTVRKFFSIVFSIVVFGNPSTLIQWIGAVIVFSALLADTILGKRKRNQNEQNEMDKEAEERNGIDTVAVENAKNSTKTDVAH